MRALHSPHRRLVAVVLALAALAAGPLATQAAYPPGPFPGPGPGGAFSSVIVSQTVGPEGATISAPYDGATYTLVVPSGAFGQDTQVTIYADNPALVTPLLPAGYVLLAGCAVAWTPAGQPSVPLTLTIGAATIPSTATVFETTGAGLEPLAAARVGAGSVSVSFSNPLGIIVARGPGGVAGAVSLNDAIARGINRGTSGFVTASIVVPKGTYVTYLVRTSAALAGRPMQIWARTKGGSWTLVTTRAIGTDGTVHYYRRISTWTAFMARFAGDAEYAKAASHGRIAGVR